MINVLIIAKNLDKNGISVVIMNYFRYIDHSKFSFTFAVSEPVASDYKDIINEYGGNLQIVPEKKKKGILYCKKLNAIMKNIKFDIAHVHGNSATMALELNIAKHNRIPVRIAHCHSTEHGNRTIHRLLLPMFRHSYSLGMACSSAAGEWIFGKENFVVINNGFEIDSFIYDEVKREKYRKKLHIENDFIIGHVGRINNLKNQEYIIEVLVKLLDKGYNVKALFVGEGPDKNKIDDMVNEKNINDKVIFYGNSDDVQGLLSAMDCFLFPSRYEGFGIALLEAQINGLPCIVSDRIPKVACITRNVNLLPIDEEKVDNWVECIKINLKRKAEREDSYKLFAKELNKYDIKSNVKKLEKMYTKYIAIKK